MTPLTRRTFLSGAATAGAVSITASPVFAATTRATVASGEEQLLRWTELPTEQDSAPLLGNGEHTAVVYRDGSAVAITFTGHTEEGTVTLRARGPLRGVGARLNLRTAELALELHTSRGTVPLTLFVHRQSGALHVQGSVTTETTLPTQRAGRTTAIDFSSPEVSALDTHRSWWQDFSGRATVSVPDAATELMLTTQNYLAASVLARRMGDIHPPQLVSTGRSELIARRPAGEEPLTRLVVGMPGTGGKNGHAEHPVTAWSLPAVVHAWQVDGDDALATEYLLPRLLRIANSYHGYLVNGHDGLLHLPISTSTDFDQLADSTHELAMLRWAARTACALAEQLGVAPAGLDAAREIADRLTDYPADETGVLLGAGNQLRDSRPEPAHLVWLHPLRERTVASPTDRTLMRDSLAHWSSMQAEWTPSSHASAAALYATARDGAAAKTHLDRFTAQSALSGRAPGGQHAAVALLRMLADAEAGTLTVFPAVPTEWADVRFTGLRMPGGLRLDAVRRAGRTELVRVHARRAATVSVAHRIDGQALLSTNRGTRLISSANATLRLAAGESASFTRPC